MPTSRQDPQDLAADSTLRFDRFEFDVGSGELRDIDDDTHQSRLPPQPAALLALLFRRRPEIVSIDEIREALWPDVQVDFDKSLHSCVRKVRAAIGDSATNPRFIETIPRRGYRFVATVTDHRTGESQELPASQARHVLLGLVGLVSLTVLVGFLARSSGADSFRIGVMPFEPRAPESALAPSNDLAESLVERLVDGDGRRHEVIGPTTTSGVDTSGGLTTWMNSEGIDYLVHGRETSSSERHRVLVEIIRGRDGAHVWTRYLDEFPDDVSFAETVESALERALFGSDRGDGDGR